MCEKIRTRDKTANPNLVPSPRVRLLCPPQGVGAVDWSCQIVIVCISLIFGKKTKLLWQKVFVFPTKFCFAKVQQF